MAERGSRRLWVKSMHTQHKTDRKPRILLWGGKSKARIIEEMIKEEDIGEVDIIFDHTIDAAKFENESIFVNRIEILRDKIQSVSHFVVCVGGEHGFARVKIAEYLEKIGLRPITLVHKKSFMEPTSKMGYGCQIMPCSVIHKFTEIGNYTIVNTGAAIDHECVIGNGVHIMGSAAIAGMVKIGDYATIGTNATILPFIKIGEGAFIGAGAVVTKDVEPYDVVVGVPARKIRKHVPKFFEHLLIELATPQSN